LHLSHHPDWSTFSDRDPTSWDLSSYEITRRRRLWWDLFAHESWQALQYGLPPSLNPTQFDTHFPFLDNTPAEDICEFVLRLCATFQSLWPPVMSWKQRFARDILSDLHGRVLAAGRPSYAALLACDARVRAHPLPLELQIGFLGDPAGSDNEEGTLLAHRHLANMLREYGTSPLHLI
jgi:hypothetical protein